MVREAEEIPIICLRPCRRMFKLKSQPPPSLSSPVSHWFKVHVEVRAPTSPLLPLTSCSLCVSEQQTPSGIDLFPPQTAQHIHTYRHIHTRTRVAFMCAAGVATHCEAHLHTNTLRMQTESHGQTVVMFRALFLFQEQ